MKRQASSMASSSAAAKTTEPETKKPKFVRKKPAPTLEGLLDVTKCNDKLWLVKIPVPLADYWDSKEPNALLGSLEITQPTALEKLKAKNTKKKAHPNITFKLVDGTSGITEGHLNFTNPPPLYIMGIDTDLQREYMIEQLKKKEAAEQKPATGEGDDGWTSGNDEEEDQKPVPLRPCLSVHGTVNELCNLAPKVTESYGKLVKERETKLNTKFELMKKTDKDVVPALHQLNRAASQIIKQAKKEEPKEKKTRAPKEELLPKIFALFEKKEYWSLAELSDETQQPVSYLKKDILEEICEYNRRGTNKGKYELKEQYKTTKQGSADAQFQNEEDDWM